MFLLLSVCLMCASVSLRSLGLCFASADVENTLLNIMSTLVLVNSFVVNSCFHSSTVMNLIQCLNPLLFSEGEAEETTVVLTKVAEVKRIPGRGTETLPNYTG